jgi:RNA polymerase sigma factor (sigma-70 family)
VKLVRHSLFLARFARPPVDEVTKLLERIAEGDRQAESELYRLTEAELRKLARHWINRMCPGGRVRTTDVIDQAFVKLMRIPSPNWQHRGAFYAFASRNILHIVIDELRRLPPSQPPVSDGIPHPINGLSVHTLLTLQQALVDLGQDVSETHRVVVELRFMEECTLDEVAEQLSISRDKVFRISKIALEYLRERLTPSFPDLC